MGKTILIVDDSASMRQLVTMVLSEAGYTVIEAVDGRHALTKLTGDKFHLIISDLNMPNMDGISFMKVVRSMPRYKFTPMIMLTTEGHEEPKREGQAIGAKAWMVKPFSKDQLLGAVAKLVLP